MQRKSCNTVRLTPHPHGPGVQGNNGLWTNQSNSQYGQYAKDNKHNS
jgi:hypothetical protein